MKWILSVLMILVLISCNNSTAINCTDSCRYNGEIICENDTLRVCEKLDNGCLAYKDIKSCTCTDNSQCLVCDEGYIDNNGVCELDKNNPCKDKSCQDNSSCKVENKKAVCICDDSFHTEDENISCVSNTKKTNCKDVAPIDASSDIIEVEITWNEENNSWNDAIDCKWYCNDNFHLDVTCKSNIKEEDCISIIPPDNAHQVIKKVDVTWNEENNSWNETPECEWACNTNFEKSGDKCINLCENFVCTKSNSSCQVINSEAICVCNSGFHNENNICEVNSKDVACDNSNIPDNAHQTTTTTTITWNEGWSTPDSCDWACNLNYEKVGEECILVDLCENFVCGQDTSCQIVNNEAVCICDLADSITKSHQNQSLRNAYPIFFDNSWSRDNLNNYKSLVCDVNGTEDWYKIQLQEREYFNFKVIPSSGGDVTIELYDATNNILAYVDSHGGSIIETLIAGTVESKLFYIKVKSYDNSNFLEYRIEITKGNHEIRGSFIYSIHPYYYYNRNDYSNFEAATSKCNEDSGYLIKIDTLAENNLIKTQIVENSWIGLTDNDREGVWKWIKDNTNFMNFRPSPWNRGEPNNGGYHSDNSDDEDCAELYTSGQWNDDRCNNPKAFICEFD